MILIWTKNDRKLNESLYTFNFGSKCMDGFKVVSFIEVGSELVFLCSRNDYKNSSV